VIPNKYFLGSFQCGILFLVFFFFRYPPPRFLLPSLPPSLPHQHMEPEEFNKIRDYIKGLVTELLAELEADRASGAATEAEK
jgi:hypothetical protein